MFSTRYQEQGWNIFLFCEEIVLMYSFILYKFKAVIILLFLSFFLQKSEDLFLSFSEYTIIISSFLVFISNSDFSSEP